MAKKITKSSPKFYTNLWVDLKNVTSPLSTTSKCVSESKVATYVPLMFTVVGVRLPANVCPEATTILCAPLPVSTDGSSTDNLVPEMSKDYSPTLPLKLLDILLVNMPNPKLILDL